MSTERFNLRSEGDPRAHPAFVNISSEYELASDHELASSQPVSLIQLCTKTSHSTNRTSRRARPLNLGSAEQMVVTHGVLTHDGDDRHERLPPTPLTDYPNPANYGLSDESGYLRTHPRILSEEYQWLPDGGHAVIAREQPRHPSLSDHNTQSNPLNYSSHYSKSQARESGYTSESPFLRKSDSRDPSCLDRATCVILPGRKNSAPQRKEYTPASLQIYRDNYDRPHDRSPYETFRLRHRNNRTDLPEINSGLQYGFAADVGHGNPVRNTTIRSEPPLGKHYRGRISNPELETPAMEIQNSHKSEDSSSFAFGSRLSISTDPSQRNLREKIYAVLENMNTESQTDPRPLSTRDTSGTERGFDRARGEEGMASPLGVTALASYGPSVNEAETRHTASEPLDFGSGKRLVAYQDAFDATKISPMGPGPANIELDMQADSEVERPSKTSSERIIKPPPGFYDAGIPPFFKKGAERLREADKWFHQDTRGEPRLRQFISNVGENYVGKIERLEDQVFSEEDRVFAKRTISIMGDLIASLETYKSNDRINGGQYFADFAPVESHYCDPSSKQCSYFEESTGSTAVENENDFT